MKRQETKLNPFCLALISIAGKWFAEKQWAIPILLVNISLGEVSWIQCLPSPHFQRQLIES